MPSILHEAPLELLRRNPGLVTALLTGTPAVAVPQGGSAALAPGEVTACLPVELRADAVVLLRNAGDHLAVVAESQMSRALRRKRRVWPAYLTQARARHDCPAVLMVFCRDRATARACAKPIPTGHPGFVLTPIVIGPDDLPDPDQPDMSGAAAELATLAAWAGRADLRDPATRVRTLQLIADLDAERLATYTRIILIAAPDESSRHALEALMATVFKNEFIDKIEATAEARGEARMILQILSSRRIAVPDEIRDQVLACADLAQLEAWGRKAATAQNIEEIFDGGGR
jgi:hypothetical protein